MKMCSICIKTRHMFPSVKKNTLTFSKKLGKLMEWMQVDVYNAVMKATNRRERWRVPVIQRLGGLSCRMDYGWEFCPLLSHVDRASRLSTVSIWWNWGSLEPPGRLRRGEPAQNGNVAGKIPRTVR